MDRQTNTAAQIQPRQRWVNRRRRHRGLVVEVLRVTEGRVRTRPIGSWSRSQRSNVWMVAIEHFLQTYTYLGREVLQAC